uniref:Uncharacterized protein n=1 Tax=Compsopogon caeruleus TaxID=31354 RepID=A0A7S1TBU2_9RHOD
MVVGQGRADLLAVGAAAVLVLLEVAARGVTLAREADVVELDGVEVNEGDDKEVARWAEMLLGIAQVRSVVVWRDGEGVLVRKGKGSEASSEAWMRGDREQGTVVDIALRTGRRAYLADLAMAPARVEFEFLPARTQAVVVWPVDPRTAVILGTNRARCFQGVDFGWLQAIIDQIQSSLR